tara:strand:+ start:498 stop:665 length:168 start_codon:yes stop_codon:yes gene_type:complete
MRLRRAFKIALFIIAILGFIVVGIMYSKLSFIDWPYLIGGVLFLALGVFFQFKKT